MKRRDKKIEEARALTAARKAGAPIPLGEIAGEEPDFRFDTEGSILGIDVSELVRPASSNFGIIPVEQETFHRELVRMGEELYYQTAGAKPVYVSIYFTDARGARQNKREMARALAEFVQVNLGKANPFASFHGSAIPQGFNTISIFTDLPELKAWWCGESGGYSVSDIFGQLTSRISAKNKLVPTYRANLGGVAVWLLLYTDVSVARSMSIPHGIEEWQFSFDFDRVFWYLCLENQVIELKRAELAEAVSV